MLALTRWRTLDDGGYGGTSAGIGLNTLLGALVGIGDVQGWFLTSIPDIEKIPDISKRISTVLRTSGDSQYQLTPEEKQQIINIAEQLNLPTKFLNNLNYVTTIGDLVESTSRDEELYNQKGKDFLQQLNELLGFKQLVGGEYGSGLFSVPTTDVDPNTVLVMFNNRRFAALHPISLYNRNRDIHVLAPRNPSEGVILHLNKFFRVPLKKKSEFFPSRNVIGNLSQKIYDSYIPKDPRTRYYDLTHQGSTADKGADALMDINRLFKVGYKDNISDYTYKSLVVSPAWKRLRKQFFKQRGNIPSYEDYVKEDLLIYDDAVAHLKKLEYEKDILNQETLKSRDIFNKSINTFDSHYKSLNSLLNTVLNNLSKGIGYTLGAGMGLGAGAYFYNKFRNDKDDNYKK